MGRSVSGTDLTDGNEILQAIAKQNLDAFMKPRPSTRTHAETKRLYAEAMARKARGEQVVMDLGEARKPTDT